MQKDNHPHLPSRRGVREGARLGLWATAAVVLLTVAFSLARNHRRQLRGITYGPPPAITQTTLPRPLGVNVALDQHDKDEDEMEQTLAAIEAAGLGWVRQRFPWADIEPRRGEYHWAQWDAIVAAVRAHHLRLIAVLDTAPPWAQASPADGHAPPRETADFGRFARAFAQRYGSRLDYYQIWDEPNLSAHWGGGYVDPAAYVALLREGFIQIKTADPTATVLSAGLAPTTENGPLNLNEMAFLRGMYAAGGGPFFDIAGLEPYGFWSGPDDRRVDPAVLNFSRAIMLREVMVEHGDAGKAAWAVEFGWNALPPDVPVALSPWGSDSEEKQATRTIEAIARAREEWPWLGVMLLPRFRPPPAPHDPRRGFALVDEQGQPRLLYQRIEALATAPPRAYPGRYRPDHPAAGYDGGWRVTPLGADVGPQGGTLTIAFHGTRLDLTVRRGAYRAHLWATVDGQPANALPRDEQGRAYLILYDPLYRTVTVPVARGLPDGPHEAVLTAERGWGQWAIAGWTVSREASEAGYRWSLLGLGLAALVCAAMGLRAAWRLPWRRGWDAVEGRYRAVGDGPALAVTIAAAALFYFAPTLPLSLIGLALLAAAIVLRPDSGLAVVAFSIPFFLQPKLMAGKAFSMVEITILLCAAAWLARVACCALRVTFHAPSSLISRLSPLDYAVAFLVAVSALSLLVAENFGVANRELRVVVIEPALFYFLLRATPLDRRAMWRIVDGLVLAGVAVALIGLYQYAFTADVITAEGVRRIRAVYGSPNNLSLFLDRIAPLVIAVAAFGRSRRRWAYAAAGLPVFVALYLTYSRGAWLLALPAAFLFMGAVRGGRALWAALGAVAATLLALLPLAGTERLASLLRTEEGTTFVRLKLWQGTLNMIGEHPLFGVGLDNFLYQYRTRYILPDAWAESNLSHPHNVVLDFWTRLGVLGVAALAWLEVAFFRAGLRLYRRLADGDERALALGLMASMVACLAHGLIDNSYFLVDLAFVFMLTLGVMQVMSTEQRVTSQEAT